MKTINTRFTVQNILKIGQIHKLQKNIPSVLLFAFITIITLSHFSIETPARSNPKNSISHVAKETKLKDLDSDGFPDSVELIDENNRSSFRRWFTSIVESQFYAIHPDWPEIRRDCIGLILFAYKEALKTHNDKWLKSFKYITNPSIPDIKAYRYPEIPILGTLIFRSEAGPFQESDLKNNIFQPVATARVLMDYNCHFKGKELDDTIQEGDLLFYKYFVDERIVYHSMVLIKKISNPGRGKVLTNQENPDATDGIVVYHTGPDAKSSGEVRKLRISTLNQHPDDIWHVKPNNPHFLGFYRFNILDYQVYK